MKHYLRKELGNKRNKALSKKGTRKNSLRVLQKKEKKIIK